MPWYLLATSIFILDQASKLLVLAKLAYAVPVKVFFWFDFTLHYNRGAAFSFLSDAGGWQRWLFTGLASVVSLVLIVWLRRVPKEQWSLALGLALVLGGAVGNLVDRIRLGYVVDFISVHYDSWYFPTFNIADAAISVGAFFIIVDSFQSQDGSVG